MQSSMRLLVVAPLAALAACADAAAPVAVPPPSEAAPPTAPAGAVQALDCAVGVVAREMECGGAAPDAGGARGGYGMLGGLGAVELSASAFQTDGDTLRFDVVLRNTMTQALGTGDGGAPDPRGVRVFFVGDPMAHPGGQAASVVGAAGTGFFTGAEQPYFRYERVLWPDSTSEPRRWGIAFPAGASTVSFRVYVQGTVQFETTAASAYADSLARAGGVRLLLVGGGGQRGVAGATLPAPVVVRVVDQRDRPVPEATLNFLAMDGGSAEPRQARTDSLGEARAAWTLGPGEGTQRLRVSGTGGTVLVEAEAGPAVPADAVLRIVPDSLGMAVGGSAAFALELRAGDGALLPVGPAAWTSSDTAVAVVDASGRVHGRRAGRATVRAEAAGRTDSARVRVWNPNPVCGPGPCIGGMQYVDRAEVNRPGQRILLQYFDISDPDGVAGARATFRAADGGQSFGCTLAPWTYGGGVTNPPYGQWHCHFVIPADARPGVWTLDPIEAWDAKGNRTVHTGAEMLGRRYPPDIQFFVENLSYDTVAPRITGLTLEIGPAHTGHWLYAAITGTDDDSGIDRAGIHVRSTAGTYDRIMPCNADASGVYRCRVYVDPGMASGEIVVARASLADRAENWRVYTTEELEEMGLTARIAAP